MNAKDAKEGREVSFSAEDAEEGSRQFHHRGIEPTEGRQRKGGGSVWHALGFAWS